MKIKLLLWNIFVLRTFIIGVSKRNQTCKEEENIEVHELTVHVNANVLPL